VCSRILRWRHTPRGIPPVKTRKKEIPPVKTSKQKEVESKRREAQVERRKSGRRRQSHRAREGQKNRKQRKGEWARREVGGEEWEERSGEGKDLACSMHSLGLELHCL